MRRAAKRKHIATEILKTEVLPRTPTVTLNPILPPPSLSTPSYLHLHTAQETYVKNMKLMVEVQIQLAMADVFAPSDIKLMFSNVNPILTQP